MAGASVEVTCTKVDSTGNIHNVETEGKKHTVTGEVTLLFGFCTVQKPLKCNASVSNIEADFEGVEGLGAGGNEMGLEFRDSFKEETLTTVEFWGIQCSLKGLTAPLNGTMVGTGTPAPTSKYSGSTLNFTDAMTTETLKLGFEKASLSFQSTVRMFALENPISLTTVT